MDPIKEAFSKVKEDISSIKEQIEDLKRTINEFKLQQTNPTDNPTDRQTQQTVPTDKLPLYGLKSPNINISTGNKGVPTDRQTDQQTDINEPKEPIKFAQSLDRQEDRISRIHNLSLVLSSLDDLKKELRLMLKKLTPQEFLIFSTLYQLTDQGISVDYVLLSQKTSLSQSSMRDYILKLINKGIPIEKHKENNKKVSLSIPLEFKRAASLDTIITLRSI